MLHYVEKGADEPTVWRDPCDIRTEINRVGRGITAAHERYAALEAARDALNHHTEDCRTEELLDVLLGEAKAALGEIDGYGEELRALQKEMSETLCLMQRM